VQLGQEGDQVLQAAAETIDRPSHNDIELPCAGVTAKRVESPPLFSALGARNAVVLVDLHYFPTGTFSYFAQLTLLIGRGLVGGRDPGIENRAFHESPSVEHANHYHPS
jgi:hypothetical protein